MFIYKLTEALTNLNSSLEEMLSLLDEDALEYPSFELKTNGESVRVSFCNAVLLDNDDGQDFSHFTSSDLEQFLRKQATYLCSVLGRLDFNNVENSEQEDGSDSE